MPSVRWPAHEAEAEIRTQAERRGIQRRGHLLSSSISGMGGVLDRRILDCIAFPLKGRRLLKNTRGMKRPLATCAFVLAVALTSSLVAPSVASAQVVVHRVNGGGTAITGAPQWDVDTSGSPSPFVNATETGNNTFSTTNTIDLTHPSVPAGTPQALFQTERWDPPTAPEMQWNFPVAPGTHEVRLYFADIYAGTQSVGARVFDVSVEGTIVLNDYDIFAEVGGYKGVVKTFTVAADSNLDIDFGHVVENPKINAIEILSASGPNELGAPSSLDFGQVVVNGTSTKTVQLTNLGAHRRPRASSSRPPPSPGTNPGQFSDDFNDAI